MRVGFIGLGNQGAPIAGRIVGAGYDTTVWARRPAALDAFRGTAAHIASSTRELGEGLDVLATCVFDAAGTNEVLFGDAGAANGMQRDGVIIVHSTVSPSEIVAIADRAWAEHGLRVLDAPVSGGSERAAAGQMVTMVGGPVEVYDRCLPILESFSELVVHLGQVGAGQHAKLINNALLAAHLGLAEDAYAIGGELGLDTKALARILVRGSGRSFGLEMLDMGGSMQALAAGQSRPTLVKDVALLGTVVAGRSSGQRLVASAAETTAELDRLGGAG